MMKRVVFFTNWPLNKRDYERFGAEVLTANGFEVLFFDFSYVLFPGASEKATIPDPIAYQGHSCFRNKEEAGIAISKLTEESIIVFMLSYGLKTFWIYKAISKTKACYAIFISNAVPNIYTDTNSFIRKILRKLRRISPARFLRYCKNYPFSASYVQFWGIKPATVLLAGGVKSPEIYAYSTLRDPDTEVLWAHTLDYDIYLSDSHGSSDKTQDKAIFFDVGAPRFLRDDITLDRTSSILSEEKYYPSLCRFFDKVEKELKIKIEIAAHPGSNHALNPIYFGERTTVRGKTLEMVKQSKFVITHASTAINFPVLLNKPIIFITTDEYEVSSEGSDIKSFALCFNKKPINIDRLSNINWDKELIVDKSRYEKYANDYIKKKGTEDLNSWQIFANWIKCKSQALPGQAVTLRDDV